MAEPELKDDHFCFACGALNPDGLRLTFDYPEPGLCRTEWVPVRKFQGWQGILHGGIIATLLDEAFAHSLGGAARGAGQVAVTAQITVRFEKPVRIGERIFIEGRVVGEKGRVIKCEAAIRDASGNELATGLGTLVKIKPAQV